MLNGRGREDEEEERCNPTTSNNSSGPIKSSGARGGCAPSLLSLMPRMRTWANSMLGSGARAAERKPAPSQQVLMCMQKPFHQSQLSRQRRTFAWMPCRMGGSAMMATAVRTNPQTEGGEGAGRYNCHWRQVCFERVAREAWGSHSIIKPVNPCLLPSDARHVNE